MKKAIKELVIPAELDKLTIFEQGYRYDIGSNYSLASGEIFIDKEVLGDVPPEKLLVAIRFKRWWERLWFQDGWCGGKK